MRLWAFSFWNSHGEVVTHSLASSTKRFYTFRKPSQTISLLVRVANGSGYSIVDDFDTDLLSISSHVDSALMRTAMPDDICDSFAHSPGKNSFNRSWKSGKTILKKGRCGGCQDRHTRLCDHARYSGDDLASVVC